MLSSGQAILSSAIVGYRLCTADHDHQALEDMLTLCCLWLSEGTCQLSTRLWPGESKPRKEVQEDDVDSKVLVVVVTVVVVVEERGAK